jgi:hypothetical protein
MCLDKVKVYFRLSIPRTMMGLLCFLVLRAKFTYRYYGTTEPGETEMQSWPVLEYLLGVKQSILYVIYH